MSSVRSCRGCQERSPGCHSKCEKYLKEKAKHDEQMEAYKASLRPVIQKGAFLGDDGLCRYRPRNYRHK